MSKTEPETWKQGTDGQLPKERRWREWWKEGEGSSQRTCMNDPWTWTKGWGWTVGAGSGWEGGRQK